MNWLFIHQNFPGQYVHVLKHLVAAGETVIGIGHSGSQVIEGVHKIDYAPPPWLEGAHEFAHEFDRAVKNGMAVARICEVLKDQGFMPHLVVGHNGWDETLYVKDVWPNCPLLGYFEFFYRVSGSDVDFDPEFDAGPDIAFRLRMRNAINVIGLDTADAGQTATRWQQRQYPEKYHAKIRVVHEGIDIGVVAPNASARIWLQSGVSVGLGDEVITFGTRNLEPYRGFHVFMRALPKVLQHRPNARVLIAGGDGVSYGTWPETCPTWRQKMLEELGDSLDTRRVHFLGHLAFGQYLAVLQCSAVHVYFTYPFVLSWSLPEALSVGCVVIASRTPPAEEVMRDGENGYLVDFFDSDGLADPICDVLQDPGAHMAVRAAARDTVLQGYDVRLQCLPATLDLLHELTESKRVLF